MKTTYLHCTLLDGSENMTEQKDMTIVVEDGKILSVELPLPRLRTAERSSTWAENT